MRLSNTICKKLIVEFNKNYKDEINAILSDLDFKKYTNADLQLSNCNNWHFFYEPCITLTIYYEGEYFEYDFLKITRFNQNINIRELEHNFKSWDYYHDNFTKKIEDWNQFLECRE